jgi:hypothetical protein
MTEAPYPADTRAKGWRFELDHERIRQSDTWALAPADVRPWLLMLWMVAWEQTPCGSMPDDDGLIAARIGINPKAFVKVRPALMRGWWKATDGRLYHRVITERVVDMLEYRRKEADRKGKHRGRTRDSGGSPADVPRGGAVTYDFRAEGIDVPASASGPEVKTTCPKCSHTRKKATQKCLNVNLDEGIWNCWHCGFGGKASDGRTRRPAPRV